VSQLHELFNDLPGHLGGHMLLSASSLAAGLMIGLPLGILVSRRPLLAEGAITLAGILQTIPSLALLALMVPLLGGQIGFWPAFLALVIYSMLPILANTVVGIRGVDPALLEAADALGMNRRQRLWRVELPLAAPVLLGGLRTATVLVVATATLATPVGQQTLGNYIFQGLNIRDTPMIVFGCALAAALAVAFDQLIRVLAIASRRGNAALFRAGVAGLLLLVAVGLAHPIADLFRPEPVVVGSADYSEQHILGETLSALLREAGFRVDQRKNMPQIVGLDAVCSGAVDCYVDYTGMIWTTKMKRAPAGRRTTLLGVAEWLRAEHGVECLGPLGFQNAYALAMRRDVAVACGITTLDDLAGHARGLRIGDDTQFFKLDEWRRVRDAYGLSFKVARSMSPERMYDALRDNEVDVISAYTTDGRIEAYQLVVLDDPREAFPPYDAVLLLSRKAAGNERIRRALLPAVGAIDGKRMTDANKRVDVEHWSVRDAARELLDTLGAGERPAP
jgi:osmoprotectant transport system permease protein